MKTLHPALEKIQMPERIRQLPIDDRGYPIPWFVEYIDGKPDFRVTDKRKLVRAVNERRCFVCGGLLGRYMAFVAGPMCGINRTSGEPPSHRDCGIFSATACPFLSKPQVERRTNNLPEEVTESPSHIRRNPGVALVWITRGYQVFPGSINEPLFRMGRPDEVLFFCEGRKATREEIMRSVDGGFPELVRVAREQDIIQPGAGAQAHLMKARENFICLLDGRPYELIP